MMAFVKKVDLYTSKIEIKKHKGGLGEAEYDVYFRAHPLIPGILERSDLALSVHPHGWSGPNGMQGLAAADGLVVVEHGTRQGSLVPLLPLPGVLVG